MKRWKRIQILDRPLVVRLFLSVLVTVVVISIQWAIRPVLPTITFMLLYPAVMFAALVAGRAAGYLSLVLTLVAADFLFLGTEYSFDLTLDILVRISLYALTNAFIIYIIGLFHKQNKQVRDQQEYFRELVDNAPTMFWITDTQGSCTFLSKQWYDFTAQTPREALGHGWLKATHPEDVKKTETIFVEASKNRQPFVLRYRLRNKDGHYRWAMDSGNPRFDEKGEFFGFVGTVIDIHDEAMAEERRQGSEERLALSLQASKIGFYEWDVEKDILYFSEQMKKDWGIEHVYLKDLNSALSLIHELDRERVFSEIQRCIELKSDYHVEYRVTRPSDHQVIWVEVRGQVQTNTKGEVTRWLGTSLNITERKTIEESLRSAHRELQYQSELTQTITDNVSSALFMMDAQGFPTFMNPAAERLTGYVLNEIKGRPLHYAVHYRKPDGSIYPMEECPIDNAQAELKAVQNAEEVFVDRHGRLFPVSYSVAPLQKEGRVIGSVLEFRDISQEIEFRKQIQESEARVRAYMDSMPQMAFVASKTGDIFYFNARHYEYFGVKPGDHEGWKWRERDPIHHPEDLERTIARWTHSLETGEDYEIEYRLLRHDGQYRWHLGRAIPIRNSAGEVLQWFGTNTDIHDQKLIEDQLKSSIQVRDDFLSIASHELKTPLTSLKLQAQIFKKKSSKNESAVYDRSTVDRLAEQTEKQISRLNRLVDDMLDIGRIRSGKLVITPAELDLGELVRDLIERMRPQFSEVEGRAPSVTVQGDLRVTWDRLRIEQVLSNLFTNAIRYGRLKPITIRIDGQGERIHMIVEDRGIGIASDHQSRIFDRFERAIDASEVSGLGLGLYITKQIVLSHSGKIWVESELGQGSQFHVELPRRILA